MKEVEVVNRAVLWFLAGHFLSLVFYWFYKRNGNNLSFVKNKLKIFLLVLTVCFLLILEAQISS